VSYVGLVESLLGLLGLVLVEAVDDHGALAQRGLRVCVDCVAYTPTRAISGSGTSRVSRKVSAGTPSTYGASSRDAQRNGG